MECGERLPLSLKQGPDLSKRHSRLRSGSARTGRRLKESSEESEHSKT